MQKFCTAILFIFLLVPAVRAQNAQNTITTVAGGVPNNINALSVGIGYVGGIATDSSGNLYVSDESNGAVYKISKSGELTTVAGIGTGGFSGNHGPATSAELVSPSGVFVDSGGNIFIADSGNNVIREVVASTGNIKPAPGAGLRG